MIKTFIKKHATIVTLFIFVLALHSYWLFFNGATLITAQDFFEQQLQFYIDAHHKLFDGTFTFWSWTHSLGNDYLGSNTFYFMFSPFAWLSIIWPTKYIPQAMFLANMLKMILAGYFTTRYLTNIPIHKSWVRLLGALLYITSGPFILNYWFNHFNDFYVFLPLLFLLLDKFICTGYTKWLPLMIGFLIALNTPFAFSTLIFASIYCLFRYLAYFPKFNWRHFCRKIITYIGICLYGVLIAGIAFIPTLIQLSASERIGQLDYAIQQTSLHHILSILLESFVSLHFPPSSIIQAEWFRSRSFIDYQSLTLYVGPFALLSTITLFKLVSKRMRTCIIFYFSVLFICFHVPLFNSVINGVGNVTFRWGYIIVLSLIPLICFALDHLDSISRKLWSYLICGWTLMFGLALFIIMYYGSKGDNLHFYWRHNVIPTLIFTCCLIYILYGLNSRPKPHYEKYLLLLLAFQGGFNFHLFMHHSVRDNGNPNGVIPYSNIQHLNTYLQDFSKNIQPYLKNGNIYR